MSIIYGKTPVSVTINGETLAEYTTTLGLAEAAGAAWSGTFTPIEIEPIKITLDLTLEGSEQSLIYTMDGYPAYGFAPPGKYKALTFVVEVDGEPVESTYYVTNIQKLTPPSE